MNLLWTLHTAIVEKSIKPGTLDDKRFIGLALCGEIGELANFVKKEWRGSVTWQDIEFVAKVKEEVGDIHAYLELFACAFEVDLPPPNLNMLESTNRRFIALCLAATGGKIADMLSDEWWGNLFFDEKVMRGLQLYMMMVHTYLYLFAKTFEWDLDQIREEIILPKIRNRWPDLVEKKNG